MLIRRMSLHLIALAVLCCSLSGAAGVMTHAPTTVAAEDLDLTGSWIVAVIQPGPPIPPGLDTFTADGNVLITTPQLTNSLGHGAWVRTGYREYLFTFIVLQHNAAGEFTGIVKVRSTAVLDDTGDAFTGEFIADLINSQGILTRSLTGMSQGSRITAEPLTAT